MRIEATGLTGARWRKSSRSNGGGGAQCVELACLEAGRAVRDSKAPTGPALLFAARAFQAFMAEAASGSFDRK
ncbi:DUF397 domain-containing protein [Actinosynnema sp. NPDC091369]